MELITTYWPAILAGYALGAAGGFVLTALWQGSLKRERARSYQKETALRQQIGRERIARLEEDEAHYRLDQAARTEATGPTGRIKREV